MSSAQTPCGNRTSMRGILLSTRRGGAMREVIELCMQVDVLAAEVYATMSVGTAVPELADTFSRLASEERSHIGWWRELIDAWDQGLAVSYTHLTLPTKRIV